jgi:phosphoglycerate dehydrogenase-like enzyme
MTLHRTLFVTQRAPRHQQAALDAAPPELEVVMRQSPSKEAVLALLPDAEFFISERTGVIDADMIAAGKSLRLIQRLGSQTYDVDLDAARRAGIPVCCWPLTTCIMVAEHTLMLILALAKRLGDVSHVAMEAGDWGIKPRPCDANTFAYNWSGRRNLRSLSGSTVGILGMGEIGSELAPRLGCLGCTVLYNKRTRLPAATEAELNVHYASLAEIQAQSDFLCSLLPHSDETAQMIDAAFIRAMKPGAYLINTGSSTTLDEPEVAEAVRQGQLAGLATDGYAWEPIRADNPLLPLVHNPGLNVILTPHVAAGELSAHRDARVQEYTNLRRVLAGEPLLHRLV